MADQPSSKGFWWKTLGVLLLLAVFGALGYQALFVDHGLVQ